MSTYFAVLFLKKTGNYCEQHEADISVSTNSVGCGLCKVTGFKISNCVKLLVLKYLASPHNGLLTVIVCSSNLQETIMLLFMENTFNSFSLEVDFLVLSYLGTLKRL